MIKLPNKIFLAATNKRWKVSYIDSPGKLVLIELPHRELVLYGRKYSKRTALHLIMSWIKLKAHAHLDALLKKLNRRVKVKYKKLIVGYHQAQWGSYSGTKTVSLNYLLLFLPPALVKYVLLHELCHARYFSHSHKFWDELARFDKNCAKHRKAIDDADDYLPTWALF